MKCIILAGGLGTRLRSVIPDLPKCMAPIAGKPFLNYIIDDLQAKGFDRIILSLGYKHELIEKWLSTLNTSAKISYIVENTPLGTGGAVKLALSRTAAEKGIGGSTTDAEENEVFILNGDTFFSIDFGAMLAQHRKTGAEVTIALKEMADFDRFGAVDYDIQTNCIRSFAEKKYRLLGMVNGGIYLINHDALASYPESFSLEQDYFEKIAPGGKLFGYSKDCHKYFIDIGVPEDYAKAQADFSDPETTPCLNPVSSIDNCRIDCAPSSNEAALAPHPVFDALFMDRDGVINKQIVDGYVRNVNEFEFLPGVLEAMKTMSPFFKRIIVISNQRGVGKGLMTKLDLNMVNAHMAHTIQKAGGRIDKIYSCTDIDEDSPDRKPNTGMALMAKRDFPDIDFKKCIMVGDSISDIQFANNAGIPAILLGNKYEDDELADLDILARYESLEAMSKRLFASLQ